jgi:hypothetical protein
MLLLQNTTIIKHNMRINILESGGLAKSNKLVVDKAILNSIEFLDVIYDIPTCFSYKITYKCIRANRHTETNETFRAKGVNGNFRPEVCQCGADSNDAVRYIERSLLRDALSREDGCLSDIELQASIFFENGLKLSQDLKGHRWFGFNVSVVGVCYRPSLLELC